jgi:hypothetical protein
MPDRLFPDKLEFVAPEEILKAHGHDFENEIPAGDSLSLANSTVTAKDDDGTDVTGTIVSGKAVSGTSLTAHLANFTAGKNYVVTYRAAFTTSTGVRDRYTLIKCRSQSAVA